jgi:hypothetical protein
MQSIDEVIGGGHIHTSDLGWADRGQKKWAQNAPISTSVLMPFYRALDMPNLLGG